MSLGLGSDHPELSPGSSYQRQKFLEAETSVGILEIYTVFQKSDAKIQIAITTAYLIRIKYPLSILLAALITIFPT